MSIFNKMSLPEVYERFLACGTGIVARCARRRLGRRRYEQAHPVRVRAHDSRASLTPADEAAQGTRLPFGACPGRRNVLIKSASPRSGEPASPLERKPTAADCTSRASRSAAEPRFRLVRGGRRSAATR